MKSDLATRFERMSNQDILLVCGELTAGELRAVKAVLLWVSGQVKDDTGPQWRFHYDRLAEAVSRVGSATELAKQTAENIALREALKDARRQGMLDALKYALAIINSKRALNRTPAYLVALEEIELHSDAAIERLESGEEMESLATVQSKAIQSAAEGLK